MVRLGGYFFMLLAARYAEATSCDGVNAISPACHSNEVTAKRDTFYVGGRYVNATAGTLTYDQLYVEKITPAHVNQTKPIVFFHGGGTSGVVRTRPYTVLECHLLTIISQRRG